MGVGVQAVGEVDVLGPAGDGVAGSGSSGGSVPGWSKCAALSRSTDTVSWRLFTLRVKYLSARASTFMGHRTVAEAAYVPHEDMRCRMEVVVDMRVRTR